ncbi:MAG: biopolymer transporter ExbD [Gallionellaceae bacterium]|nr:biopolymer transporter ExbD [Gallionellaceae bacterium]
MARRRRHHRHHAEADIDVTALLNVLVVLIAFLILSAVFSRISIQEINLPSEGGSSTTLDKQITIEVIVRKDAFEIGDGQNIVASIPKMDMKYDFQKLAEHLLRLKEKYKDKQDVTILIEPDIAYEHLIKVMDTVKIAEVKQEGQERPHRTPLFPQVSIGDAP